MMKNFSDAALVFMFTKCYSMNKTNNILEGNSYKQEEAGR